MASRQPWFAFARRLRRKCCVLAVDPEEASILAKKKRAPRRKRDWRVIVFLILSIIIALSMLLAFLPGLLNVPT